MMYNYLYVRYHIFHSEISFDTAAQAEVVFQKVKFSQMFVYIYIYSCFFTESSNN